MKKITFVNGSARNNGNTSHLLSSVARQLDLAGFQSEILNLSDFKINYCLGCHYCETTRKCIQNDDIHSIYEKLAASDIICIASPSYWGYVTGQLKVFFDRSTPYCNTIDGKTTFPSGKLGISIALRAGSSLTENHIIIQAIEHYYSHLEISPIANITFERIRVKSDLETDVNLNKIKSFIQKL